MLTFDTAVLGHVDAKSTVQEMQFFQLLAVIPQQRGQDLTAKHIGQKIPVLSLDHTDRRGHVPSYCLRVHNLI